MKFVNLVCCHKESNFPTGSCYMPIHVGKAISALSLPMAGDDVGDNISYKNLSYCELTGVYWAWKNLKSVDVIGLCHYRRYFDFHRNVPLGFPDKTFSNDLFHQIDLTIPDEDIRKVKDGGIILSKRVNFRMNLMLQYCMCHISDDYKILSKIIHETQDNDMVKAFDEVMLNTNRLSPYNMFIMSWEEFDLYCNWLFSVLSLVEKEVNIEHYTPAQARIFGYMGERLLNVWVKARNLDVIYKPVIFFDNEGYSYKSRSIIKYKLRSFLNFLSCVFQRYRF